MEIIYTRNAPTPGKYSQATRIDLGVGYLIYTAGQTGNQPPTIDQEESVVDGGIVFQTTQALRNLEAILSAAGATLQHAIKVNVYLEDMDQNKPSFDKAYEGYFLSRGVKALPPRTLVEAKVPLPTEPTIVEIDMVAFVPK